MFAIDHAATALLIKHRYPSVPMAPLLVSVQAMELAWVGLNYLGIERTTTEASDPRSRGTRPRHRALARALDTAVGPRALRRRTTCRFHRRNGLRYFLLVCV